MTPFYLFAGVQVTVVLLLTEDWRHPVSAAVRSLLLGMVWPLTLCVVVVSLARLVVERLHLPMAVDRRGLFLASGSYETALRSIAGNSCDCCNCREAALLARQTLERQGVQVSDEIGQLQRGSRVVLPPGE